MIHCPMYNTFVRHRGDPQVVAEQTHIEPLLVKHQVNFVFTGHVHAYMRTSPVAMGKVDPHGPVHITVGAGGRDCDAPFQSSTPEDWVEFRDEALYGYGILHIYNRTHAQWHWIHSGKADKHNVNEVWRSNLSLPVGGRDLVTIQNSILLEA